MTLDREWLALGNPQAEQTLPRLNHRFMLQTSNDFTVHWVTVICCSSHGALAQLWTTYSVRRRGEATTRAARNRVLAKAEQHLEAVGATQADFDALAAL